ncbi:MAG: S-methyl-5-thioribose-1-phosphate isomerase [Planctomycetales bacterium]|nr:S-methyl-5-thioribose-1-phosphate isomerase [Planctomycetales bacterium]NIM08990.1 S-methyl-5-thioribose-1-phosphate isomerase [Planctomycetales bacterium]NIN08453.1 S-methyl-5-thioribose-1-phosphate isomerase [Planctomycetales bacterium]NIN77587.1 S-methyl-5-thioribose-1-phosphate isomerase [Planctomycetales bacterium]NIO34752.1 S-methyl-5-thioribose-1-phosphate isomerase [Planctomycetales bacterium]
MTPHRSVETLRWVGDQNGHLVIIDQTRLPTQVVEIELRDVEAVWEAIRSLRVRGAPAIGIAAAYGVVLGLQESGEDEADVWARLDAVTAWLATSRPTAVNLCWALQRLQEVALGHRGQGPASLRAALLTAARALHEEDRDICRAIGRHGGPLLADGSGVLTHCNAGGLATADYGTALAVIFAAHEAGRHLQVYVDETRPLLQGARLTVWELQQRGIDVTLICDSTAAQVMRERRVQAVITGADRIAANGDVANKIGTYQVALAAAAHELPFYVAAPTSTFDLSLASGEQIPIEQRDPAEITHGFGRQIAPEGTAVYNPAFDVTPARLIRAIVCEKGVIQPVTQASIAQCLNPSSATS